MGSAPKPPPPPKAPDPYESSNAQWATDIEGAVSTIHLKNADEDTPEAHVRYVDATNPDGTLKTRVTYTTDANGNHVAERTIVKPKKVVTLTPKMEQQWNVNHDVTIAMNQWALVQTGFLSQVQGTPLDDSGLVDRLTPPPAPSYDAGGNVVPGALVESIDPGDLTAHIAATRDAIEVRLQYQIDIDRQKMEDRLANQGVLPGSVAYDRAMKAFADQANDAHIQAFLAAQKEQTRIVQTQAVIADHANRVQALKFNMAAKSIDFKNAIKSLQYRGHLDATEYINHLRERQLQEKMAIRSVVINEITSLTRGGHVQVPQFQQYQGSQVKPAPIMDAIYRSAAVEQQSAAIEQQNYQTQVAQQNQMWGGIMGLAGNVAGAFLGMPSDKRLKCNVVKIADDVRGFGWYEYQYIWGGERQIGVMAQEVKEVVPEAVGMDFGFYAVDYERLM